jgi:hypothetical protein
MAMKSKKNPAEVALERLGGLMEADKDTAERVMGLPVSGVIWAGGFRFGGSECR